uniref:Death domain-containing protein n=1 Tax=Branchiostoma floridae TaxID=7739 RepID=C3ZDV5_BRAFL|eukprot:XP_002592900.1 hypothetical protein BRAFLDRAFT_65486 [Branchiostoma floridae]
MESTVNDYFDKVIKNVSYKWDDLARNLGFERGEIEAIRATVSLQGPDKKCREVLERWQNRNGAKATLQVLQQALIDIEEKHTAEELHVWKKKETQHSLKTFGQEMKTTGKKTMEKLDGLKVELQEGHYLAAKDTGQSIKGPNPIFEKLPNHLQDRYRRELARIRPLPWCEDFYLNLDDMFTTLEMVGRDGQKKDTAVAVEDMFKLYNDSVPKTIRVEGDPGIGKTTLCYKIVYDFSAEKSKFQTDNKFSSFKLVLYVEMRKVPHDATDLNSTIFQQVFPTAYYKHEEEFWDYVECNPEDVLFVLDGLDEMPEETREKLKIADFIRVLHHLIS